MSQSLIADKDISIVVQGPIIFKSAFDMSDNVTRDVCARLKKLFPDSELILSTWEGSNITGILYDKLVLSNPPPVASFIYNEPKHFNNCNKLITSTKEGIKAASRKYVFKVRSDLFVFSKRFLKFFSKFEHFDPKYKFVKNRIIAFSIYSLKAEGKPPFIADRPYHVSDWAYFANKEDLLEYYSLPLVKEPEFSQWFLTRPKFFFEIWPMRLWRMSPEEYITSTFFKKFLPIKFEHTRDTSNNNIELSAKLIANNFLILDQTQFSLLSLKYGNLQLLFDFMLSKTAIFHHSWLRDYLEYCKVPKRSLKEIIYSIRIFNRKITYQFLNCLLRLINGKSQRVVKQVCSITKKLINNS